MSGHSNRTLAAKLGIKSSYRIRVINPPVYHEDILGRLPEDVTIAKGLQGQFDLIHFFSQSKEELRRVFPILKRRILHNGMLWVSWPKGSSNICTDLSENDARKIGLENGMVDVKVCAIDENWSGLKFMFRLRGRKSSSLKRKGK